MDRHPLAARQCARTIGHPALKVRLAAPAIMIGLFVAACSKDGTDADAAATEGSDAAMTDALVERAKEIEARADQSVKQVEAAAEADLKVLKAEASKSEQAKSGNEDAVN